MYTYYVQAIQSRHSSDIFHTHTHRWWERIRGLNIFGQKEEKDNEKEKSCLLGFWAPPRRQWLFLHLFCAQCSMFLSILVRLGILYLLGEIFRLPVRDSALSRSISSVSFFLFLAAGRQRSWNPQAIQLHSQPFQLSQLKFSRCHTVIVKTCNGWNLMTGGGSKITNQPNPKDYLKYWPPHPHNWRRGEAFRVTFQ
jgi:hypothetical protein